MTSMIRNLIYFVSGVGVYAPPMPSIAGSAFVEIRSPRFAALSCDRQANAQSIRTSSGRHPSKGCRTVDEMGPGSASLTVRDELSIDATDPGII